ncbi:GNAT family N-acetyltransferase [Pseudoalteromonas xiamenensis]|jgi:GNAT superfamily N-acetyltransferase|uniref:GNAT family N-acetyltransferase n=1 Tax=Pseudoalteromonas xiamenensis TaxID=882626 RepID=A0A975DGQ3_9GAMM|nr:GNAT family N-acetyltransferase [Pseudoalteromonas xiamenensis]QTH71533.1 GNAT family N-acetyltransferase [Pseudoalteromonas xiamenensis]
MTQIQVVTGAQISEFLDALAVLRIAIFRDFPYLYEGTLEYEKSYLSTYAKSNGALVVLILDDGKVVGASTGLPLSEETIEFKQPFIDAGYNVDEIFYCAESVLLPAYRGRGLGKRFFEEREAHAKQIEGIKHVCFCAVVREEQHPLKPSDYKTLDPFWMSQGYSKTRLTCEYVWQDIDKSVDTAKTMQFWMKSL